MPTVAILGASADRSKYGNKALRAFRNQGFTVVPIHPSATEIEGEKAYATVVDYPGTIDEASVYLPPAVEKGIPIVWLNPGADGPEVISKARALGLETRVACSIIGVGDSPGRY